MDRGDTEASWHGDPVRPLYFSDTRALFGGTALLSGLARWKWLEALRLRFDLAIEVLDVNLDLVFDPLPDIHPSAVLQAVVQTRRDAALRDAAALIARSARPQSFRADGLIIRMFPLLARESTPPVTLGFLLIADSRTTDVEPDIGRLEEIDRRLDGAGQWLVAAVEAALQASTSDAPQTRASQRLVGVIDVIDELSRRSDPREIVNLTMEAIALWFDADVRVYRQTVSGSFNLYACLPGVHVPEPVAELAGHQIWGREDVFTFDSVHDVEKFGWDLPFTNTLFVPIGVEESTEWLLTVSEATEDPSIRITLGVVGRVVSALLTDRQRQASDRLGRKLSSILAFGDAPFDAIARIALEAVGLETGAESARVAIYYPADGVPVVSLAWGRTVDEAVPFVEAGTIDVTPETVTVGTAAGASAVAVLALRWSGAALRTPPAVRVARSAGAIFGIWLSGALIKHRDVRVPTESEYSPEFVGRVREQLDRLGRLKVGGAVAVVLPAAAAPTGPELDDLVHVVQEQVRSSDVVGIIEAMGAAVLLPEATRDVASAVVGRLALAARAQGLSATKVGVATFTQFSESPETLLHRALMNARHGSSLS